MHYYLNAILTEQVHVLYCYFNNLLTIRKAVTVKTLQMNAPVASYKKLQLKTIVTNQ